MSRYQGRHRAPGGHIARRFAALGLLSSSTVAAVMFIAPTPVSAQAPDAAAWWNATNAGDPAPTPPAPPDVKSGDLFVQGSNTAPLPATPLGAAPATTQAVSGVSFDLPAGALVNSMTLQFDGSAPPQISVVACATKEPFTSTENGAWSEVPAYDGNACVPGKLKGDAVEFADVGKLVLHDALSVLILPGPLDRIVFKAPDDKTLDVSSGGGVGAAAPPLGVGVGSTTTTGGKGSSGEASVGGSAVTPPSSLGLPDSGTTTTPDAGSPPVVAGSGTGTPAASQTQLPAASSSGLSTRNRRIIALIVIAAEVLGYALLMRNRAPAAAPAAGAAAAAGSKLRAPDRWAGGRAAAVAGTAGVGRFRRDRVGAVPHL